MSSPDPFCRCRSIRRGVRDSAGTTFPGTFGSVVPKEAVVVCAARFALLSRFISPCVCFGR